MDISALTKRITMKRLRIALMGVVMLVSACGGDDPVAGIEGTGLGPTPSAAIVGNGQITGIGSIFVGGVEYSLDNATISIDGHPGTAADLAVGQVVTFQGTLGNDQTHGQAVTVTSQTDIAGQIDAVDSSGTNITVLGQKIFVDPALTLSVGTTVAISGFRDALGVWTARRLGPAPAALPLIVTGSIDNLSSDAKTFTVTGLSVDYSNATIAGLPNGPANGEVVRITGSGRSTGGVLMAATVTGQNPALPGTSGDAAFVEGWITRFASAQDFDVNGHHIVSSSATKVTPDQSSVALNRFAMVNGTRTQDGGVDAQTTVVEVVRSGMVAHSRNVWGAFRWQYSDQDRLGNFGSVVVDGAMGTDADIQVGDVVTLDGEEALNPVQNWLHDNARRTELRHIIAGPVDSVDLGHGRLVVMGQPVFTQGFSCTNTAGDQDLAQSLLQLQPGDRVTVSGHDSRAGDVLATRINHNAAASLLVSGYVTGLDVSRSRFTLNALTIDYSQAQLLSFPSNAPLPGDHVVAFANQPPLSGMLTATRLKRVSEFLIGPANADAWVEGLITRWVSVSDFDVDGHRISLDATASCDSLSLGLNAHVVLSASLDEQGIVRKGSSDSFFCPMLVQPQEITLTGPIDAIDLANGALTLLGFTVQTNMLTRISNDSATGPLPMQLADLRPGAFISVQAVAGTLAGSVIASAIDAGVPPTAGIGQVDTVAYTLAAPAIVVAGLAIPTNASTTYNVTYGVGQHQLTPGTPAARFFSGDWQGHCYRRFTYAGSVHLTLDHAAGGTWLVTHAEAAGAGPCPDDTPAPQSARALCESP